MTHLCCEPRRSLKSWGSWCAGCSWSVMGRTKADVTVAARTHEATGSLTLHLPPTTKGVDA